MKAWRSFWMLSGLEKALDSELIPVILLITLTFLAYRCRRNRPLSLVSYLR